MTDGANNPAYEEFGLLHENATEARLAFDAPPPVCRASFDAPSGRALSAILWGAGSPEIVLVHGGAQNAHTWDTVVLALDRPVVAIDLPGHGYSDWREDKDYRPQSMAGDVGAAIEHFAPDAALVAGMSLGGLTVLTVAAERPDLVARLALIDITPGVNQEKAKAIVDFIKGPEVFGSFDEILERTMAFNPTRSRASLQRGVLHNAYGREDGTWVWRYDLPLGERTNELDGRFADLWLAVDEAPAPLTLIQGGLSPVVDDDDIAELARRRPDANHLVVEDAGHSIQGDQPVELAEILDELSR